MVGAGWGWLGIVVDAFGLSGWYLMVKDGLIGVVEMLMEVLLLLVLLAGAVGHPPCSLTLIFFWGRSLSGRGCCRDRMIFISFIVDATHFRTRWPLVLAAKRIRLDHTLCCAK